jgi:hypothetical protein
MGWTKRQLVVQAFEELGLAAYVFDLEPEQLQSALRRLDSMMGTWDGKGIRLGYPISSPESSNLDDDSNLPDAATETVFTNLALRLAPSFGKIPSVDTKATAKEGYQVLLGKAAHPIEMQVPNTLHVGAGNKVRGIQNPFMPAPTDPLKAGPDGVLDFT